ncbi:MAG TPA: S-layer protein [Methanolinea sp.]|nr:S-layer protein [Methanolinea sp.]HQK56680.1 S-layer protein [Methanolinea sp.]
MTTKFRLPSLATLVICAVLLLVPAPVLAGVEYLGGEPVITASIQGQNEFLPGSDALLVVEIENRGIPDFKLIPQERIAPDDQPSTAKLVRVGLEAGEAPFLVQTDPQMAGDIPANSRVEVPFQVKVLQNATGGTYILPLTVQYSSLSFAEQRGTGTMAYIYKDSRSTVPLQVRVTPRVRIAVVDVQAGELTAGNEGYIAVTIRNEGSLAGNECTARILRHEESPVVPVSGSAYIGMYAPGSEVQGRFKVRIDEGAQAATYPLDIVVEYLDPQGDSIISEPLVIGVPVQGAIEFKITPEEFAIPRGGTREIDITFRNNGPVTVRSAQARIVAVDPFTSTRDTASLGDLAPGEEALAHFTLSVDKTATVKEYGLETEVRYRDALDNRLISDPVKVRVRVVERTGLDIILANPVYLSVIVVILIGIGYYFHTRRKKAQEEKS